MMEFAPPKYFTVKCAILDRIDTDDLSTGAILPSERELMEVHCVSRITVRKAIDELEKDGYLYKVQGKGTFVKGEPKRQDLISLTSCTQDVVRQGMVPTRKVLKNDVIAADSKRLRVLNLDAGENVFCLARILYADGEPLNFTTAYLPHKLFPGIENHDFAATSLYTTIENEYATKITRAERTIEAVIAYDEICDYLGVDSGVPLVLFQCVTYGESQGVEYPIETFKCYYRSDKFKFYIDQVREKG